MCRLTQPVCILYIKMSSFVFKRVIALVYTKEPVTDMFEWKCGIWKIHNSQLITWRNVIVVTTLTIRCSFQPQHEGGLSSVWRQWDWCIEVGLNPNVATRLLIDFSSPWRRGARRYITACTQCSSTKQQGRHCEHSLSLPSPAECQTIQQMFMGKLSTHKRCAVAVSRQFPKTLQTASGASLRAGVRSTGNRLRRAHTC